MLADFASQSYIIGLLIIIYHSRSLETVPSKEMEPYCTGVNNVNNEIFSQNISEIDYLHQKTAFQMELKSIMDCQDLLFY